MAGGFKSLKGQLLLDGGKLAGSYFHRTVVLICHHDADGAFGLVLNRKAEARVGDVLIANMPEILSEYPIFLGGPVQPTALSYLHSDEFLPNANIMPNLSVGHSLDELIEIGESIKDSTKLRVFAGYAGWSPGQLDDEMRRKAWLTHPATVDLIFTPEPEKLWQYIIRLKGPEYKLLAEAPEDLFWN
ncbi:MAG: YqgE/AlgH family protein [Verrucomicrobiae bacterium]|nr:YqgE/AlgH family protein [Verrucomicrobiae bacterium]